MQIMKILHRGRLTIIVDDGKITVFDSLQATFYAPWISPNNHLFGQMKEFLLTSEQTEYSTWPEILELASVCRVVGIGTVHPRLTNCES